MRVSVKTITILLGSAALSLAPSSAVSQYNNPPVANANSLAIYVCQEVTVDLTANDTDPEGHYPLTLTAVDASPYAAVWIASGNFVTFAGEKPGGHTLTYTVEDSQGASSTGQISLGVFARSTPCP